MSIDKVELAQLRKDLKRQLDIIEDSQKAINGALRVIGKLEMITLDLSQADGYSEGYNDGYADAIERLERN